MTTTYGGIQAQQQGTCTYQPICRRQVQKNYGGIELCAYHLRLYRRGLITLPGINREAGIQHDGDPA